jgi:RNA polymerase sigma factor (TIGR02999 family)
VFRAARNDKGDTEDRIPSQGFYDVCLREILSRQRFFRDGGRMTMQVPANFTQLLTEWRSGHPQALDRLTPLVYDELRRLARNYMRGERGSHTLQATAVVHEAFLRLIQANVALQDRGHFFALASRLMRRVLVDHAKSRSRIKRNAGIRDLVAEATGETLPAADFDVVALDDALEGLQQMEPRLAQVIELHYFGGLTYEQIAAALGTSPATVHRDIRLARAWLLNEIGGDRPA